MPKAKKATREITKKTYEYPCLQVKQGPRSLYCFVAKATELWEFVEINRRQPDKDEGYQRALSTSRVIAISKYIGGGSPIPNSLLVSLIGSTKISSDRRSIIIPARKDAGWVIDGQHRLAGARELHSDLEFVVVAFIGLALEEQIEQFVTINREAKGVPTSLYYDLLKRLPKKRSDSELARERAADIAQALRSDDNSPLFGRIVVVTAPRRGEISLTNFVRKVAPLVHRKTGKFNEYLVYEQIRIIRNYIEALKNVFPNGFDAREPIFLQTLGFGAAFNALPTTFDLGLKHYKGFTVANATAVLKRIEDFRIEDWKQAGTGSAAELQAGNDLVQLLRMRFEDEGEGGLLRL